MNLLSQRAVLECTKISKAKLYRLRDLGKFPAPVKFLSSVGYRQDDIERWMQANVSPRFHFDDRSSFKNVS